MGHFKQGRQVDAAEAWKGCKVEGQPVRAAGVCWEAQVSLQGPQTACRWMCIMGDEGRAAGLCSLLPGVALLRSLTAALLIPGPGGIWEL